MSYHIGTARDVEWIAGRTELGVSVTTAIPPVFEAYATFHRPSRVSVGAHERAVVAELARFGAPRWWLGFLETGAHDVVVDTAPRVRLYWDWPYVLIEGGPERALTLRTGHMREGAGHLPDLFFPTDRRWLVSAMWDDAFTCVGGPTDLVEALTRSRPANARRVEPGDDCLPPGLTRD